jgi:hypothetical protein
MTRTTIRLLFLIFALLVIGIGQGVWIYQQNQQIKLLQVTEYSILFGTINETINEVDRFTKTQDRAVLENLYVRLAFMEREAQRAVRLTKASSIQKHPTTPSGLVSLILQHNVSNEQATDYLKQVQQKLLAYQAAAASAEETESNQTRYIQLWRELFQVADQKHKEWKLP